MQERWATTIKLADGKPWANGHADSNAFGAGGERFTVNAVNWVKMITDQFARP